MRRRHQSGEGARHPRRRRWQELREHPRRGIFLLPSLLTTANLFCGFLAIVLSAQARFVEAAVAVFVGVVMRHLLVLLREMKPTAKVRGVLP